MSILEKAKAAADDYARDIGGVWVVLGNPDHVPYYSQMRDVSITEDYMAEALMLAGDVVLYRSEAV